jgi:hypothetical protein
MRRIGFPFIAKPDELLLNHRYVIGNQIIDIQAGLIFYWHPKALPVLN